jgi:arylsulfatase A-like enzyme
MVLLDDTGFAQLGAFGSDIATPNIDRLANEGLRYNRFHVTALCSPSRASLLTGRNHHAVGMGFLCDLRHGSPGPRRPCHGCCATRATARWPSESGT